MKLIRKRVHTDTMKAVQCDTSNKLEIRKLKILTKPNISSLKC